MDSLILGFAIKAVFTLIITGVCVAAFAVIVNECIESIEYLKTKSRSK
jgi:hypothetical protein